MISITIIIYQALCYRRQKTLILPFLLWMFRFKKPNQMISGLLKPNEEFNNVIFSLFYSGGIHIKRWVLSEKLA